MKRILLALVLLALTAFQCAAQSVSGTVTDPLSIPLPGARVTLYNTDTSYFAEERTNGSGFFTFPAVPAGTYNLNASRADLAYKRVNVVTNGITNVVQNLTVATDTVMGNWDILLNAPEPLGGTNLGVLLPDGRIFYCHNTTDPFLFNPATNTASLTPGAPNVLGCVGIALRQDSAVVFLGGAIVNTYGPGTNRVKTWKSNTGQWSAMLPKLNGNRWYPSTTTMADGRVLTIGGGNENNPQRSKTSELFDPVTLTSTTVDSVVFGNEVSPILRLYNGKVLMTHRPPQLFDPSTNQWDLTGAFVQGPRMPNGDHSDHELVLLPEGDVIAIGYKTFTAGVYGNMVERYNPTLAAWSLGANSPSVRSRAKVVLLPNKKILVLGGERENPADPTPVNAWGYTARCDYYDPYTNAWSTRDPMNYAREYHANPIVVPDGRVIVVGGEGSPGNEPPFSVIEAYTPPYLYKGIRPVLSTIADRDLLRGQDITFSATRTEALTRVIMMSLAQVTHFMNCSNQRFVELPFTQTGTSVTATLPSTELTVPNGFYMLIGIVDDIPSKAQIVRVGGTSRVSVKVMLEGPYAGGSLMNAALRTLPSFPLTEPFTAAGYSEAAFTPGATIASSVLTVSNNNAIVDWVIVEMRPVATPGVVAAARAVLLQRDGDVVDIDGISSVGFAALATGSYCVAVKPRNHLPVMLSTSTPVVHGEAVVAVNFTLPGTQVYDTDARTNIGGVMVLGAGDVTFNESVKYTGTANDRDPILVRIGSSTPNATVSGYWREDVNLDGVVKYTGTNNDRDPILVNIGSNIPTNIRAAPLP